jgi:hypothetical protein
MYYITESNQPWNATPAHTLTGAKRAAARAQMFQGTDIYVGQEVDGEIVVVAKKLHRDALNMNAVGKWHDVA